MTLSPRGLILICAFLFSFVAWFGIAVLVGGFLISVHAVERADLVSLCFCAGALLACVGGLLMLPRGRVS